LRGSATTHTEALLRRGSTTFKWAHANRDDA
jgi:hypothetical protein